MKILFVVRWKLKAIGHALARRMAPVLLAPETGPQSVDVPTWVGASDEWATVLQKMVVDQAAPPVALGRDAVGVAQLEARHINERLLTDELGTWDPDAVDWSEASIYAEVALEAFATRTVSVPQAAYASVATHAMDLVLS